MVRLNCDVWCGMWQFPVKRESKNFSKPGGRERYDIGRLRKAGRRGFCLLSGKEGITV